MSLVKTTMESPVGVLTLVASDAGLVALLWPDDDPKRVRLSDAHETAEHPILQQAITELNEYFSGKRTVFDVPLDARGTSFQKQVWKELQAIPYGETRSYADLARSLGSVKKSRAVGGANSRNPVSIVVPCHRVIQSDGTLGGFAGTPEAKRRLLELERALRSTR